MYGSNNNSYNSYNLSSDSFALNPLGYNSQASFDVSDISNPTTSLLEPNYYGQTNPTYNQSAINLQSMNNYSPVSSTYGGSSTASNYVPSSANFAQSGFAFDAQRRSIDDQLKQLDEALMSKVSEMSLLSNSIRTNKMQLQQMHSTSSLSRNLAKGQSSIDITVGGASNGNGSGSSGSSSTSSSALSSATTISAAAMSNLSAAKKKGLSTSCKNINYEQETFY